MFALLAAALISFAAGAYIMIELSRTEGIEKIYDQIRTTNYGTFALTLQNSAWYILLAYTALATLVAYNIIPYLLLKCYQFAGKFRPELLHNTGYINAYWHFQFNKEAPAANLNIDACKTISNELIEKLAQNNSWQNDWAARPNLPLSAEELSNIILIGCTIEGICHQNNTQVTSWGRFYNTLCECANTKSKPFLPESLRAHSKGGSFYSNLRGIAGVEACNLPTGNTIEATINEAIKILCTNYSGSMLDLAGLKSRPSIALAQKNLAQFPTMGNSSTKSMSAQVIRICLRWNLWPTLNSHTSIYTKDGYNKITTSILRLLFDSNCIVGLPGKHIPNQIELKRLALKSMHIIAQDIAKLLQNSANPALQKLKGTLYNNGHFNENAAFDLVDFLLWSAAKARQPSTTQSALNPASTWTIDPSHASRI